MKSNIINKKPYQLEEFPKYLFFYDRANGMVIYANEYDEKSKEENKEWMEEYGEPLFPTITVNGKEYIEIQAAGLMYENWKNKEARDEYLFEWVMDLIEEATRLANEFMQYEM